MWFAIAVIIVLVIAVGALIAYMVRLRQAILAADAREAELTTALHAAQRDLESRAAEVRAAHDRLGAAQLQLDAAEVAMQRANDDAAAARRDTDDARDALRAARATGHDAGALWALELARSERRWRQSVAPGIDLTSPFAETDDPLRLAVDVEASALREEVGTSIDVDWAAPPDLSPDQSVVVLRLAQELLASGAQPAETLDLRVATDGDDIVLTLRARDENDDEIVVELPALPEGRVRVEGGEARVGGAAAS